MPAAQPRADVPVPSSVRALVGADRARPVWRNEVGGLTFEVTSSAGRCFVKWAPAGSGVDLNQEVLRLRWAVGFTPVPQVLEAGSDDDGSWILTAALPGENAVTARWRADPAVAVEGIGVGLRALHDALPVLSCPFRWSAQDRVQDAQRRAAAGELQPGQWHDEHRRLSARDALRVMAKPPPVDQLVVCHGDACAPNTLLDEAGMWTGHVDLGSLGIADRWADLAVATWSAEWNYGPGWDNTLLGAYGVQRDPERTAYYRLLWDLGP